MSPEAFDHTLLRMLAGMILAGVPLGLGFIYFHIPRREQRLTKDIVAAIEKAIKQHDLESSAHKAVYDEAVSTNSEQVRYHAQDPFAHQSVLFSHDQNQVAHPIAFDRALHRVETAIADLSANLVVIRENVEATKIEMAGLRAAQGRHRREDPPDFDPATVRGRA